MRSSGTNHGKRLTKATMLHNANLGNIIVSNKKPEEIKIFPVETRFVEPTFTGSIKKGRKPRKSTRALGTNPRAKGTNPNAKKI